MGCWFLMHSTRHFFWPCIATRHLRCRSNVPRVNNSWLDKIRRCTHSVLQCRDCVHDDIHKCIADLALLVRATSPIEKRVWPPNFVGSQHCAAEFSLQVPKSCTNLNPTLLYISILRTHTKFIRKNKMLALGACFPEPCSSDGRRFAASRSRLNHYQTIGSFPQERIRWNAL